MESAVLAAQAQTQNEKRAAEMLSAEVRRGEQRAQELEARLADRASAELALSRSELATLYPRAYADDGHGTAFGQRMHAQLFAKKLRPF